MVTRKLICPVAVVVLLLLQHQPGSAAAVATSTSTGAAATVRTTVNTNTNRHLTEEKFLSYEPYTTVTDTASIDLDLRDIITELAKGTHQGKLNARKIYTQGSYSKSYARLNLDGTTAPDGGLPPLDIAKGTELVGYTNDGKQVVGRTLNSYKRGDLTIDFLYHASTVQASWTDCHVGGNPNPNLNGCLTARGSIEIGDIGTFSYTYNPRLSNFNARSLQILSTKAEQKMLSCKDGCPYPAYLRMHDYYGIADYGNRWITSAFNRTRTNFIQSDGDFEQYIGPKDEGANEAILKGSVVLNVWMYVIFELEHAQSRCEIALTCNEERGDDCSNTDRFYSWDKAVAFFTGSIPKATGYGGHLVYSLAQKRCHNFGTCLPTTSTITNTNDKGMALVNSQIFQAFRSGQQDLIMKNCNRVSETVLRITELMTIPLIQGTLRYAYHQEDNSINNLESNVDKNQAKTEAEGATYAAAILPFLHSCNKADAKTLYDNMRTGNGGTTDFKVVKSLLERNYDCLGVTCADIGGLVDVVQKDAYMPGAEPCGVTPATTTTTTTTTTTASGSSGDTSSSSSKTTTTSAAGDIGGPNIALAAGITISLVLVFVIVAVLVSRKETTNFHNSNQQDYHTGPPVRLTEAEMT